MTPHDYMAEANSLDFLLQGDLTQAEWVRVLASALKAAEQRGRADGLREAAREVNSFSEAWSELVTSATADAILGSKVSELLDRANKVENR